MPRQKRQKGLLTLLTLLDLRRGHANLLCTVPILWESFRVSTLTLAQAGEAPFRVETLTARTGCQHSHSNMPRAGFTLSQIGFRV